MIRILLMVCASAIFVSCGSVNYPKVEDSKKLIDSYNSKLENLEKGIKAKNIGVSTGNDLILKVPNSTFNRIFDKISQQKAEDLILDFWYSPAIVSKEVNVLGIKTNHLVDLESGKITLDLKNLKFENFSNNVINGIIEIEGKGNVTVVGKSAGLSAKASPMLLLNLNEGISFDISSDKNSNLSLKAKSKQLKLKTKTSISLFGLELPWNQEVPIEVSQVIPPISVPLALESEISFPLPAQKFGNDKVQYAPYLLKLSQTKISAENNKLEYRTNIDFIKK